MQVINAMAEKLLRPQPSPSLNSEKQISETVN
jgi:hypothetical protein